jgi:hypothetical protein
VKGKSKDAPAEREVETRLLAEVLQQPERLRERLILAIALTPPKGKSPLRVFQRRR